MNKAAAFLRVSSVGQFKDGDSPAQQLESIEELKEKYQAEIVNVFTFHESAGLEQQPLDKTFDYCLENNIKYIFLKSIDRYTRHGARAYLRLFDKFKKIGCEIIDAEGTISHEIRNTLEKYEVEYDFSKYRPTEEDEVRKAQEAENERRRILTRLISAEVRYGRLGYWTGGPSPFGYKAEMQTTQHGKRAILVQVEDEAKFIRRIFELKASGLHSDQEIVNQLNEAGYESRTGLKLKDKQLQKYLKNTLYCLTRSIKRQRGRDQEGKIIWRKDEPVRLQGQQLISDELFNQANKTISIAEDENGKVQILRGDIPTWQLFKSRQSEQYPFKPFVLVMPSMQKTFHGKRPSWQIRQGLPTVPLQPRTQVVLRPACYI